MPRTGRGRSATNPGATLKRLIKTVFGFYPVLLPVVLFCILLAAVAAAAPAIFQQRALSVVEEFWASGDWETARPQTVTILTQLIVIYIVSLTASFIYTRLMATITQGCLMKFRTAMFSLMQNLPIKYFDTHSHGDIMSHYTNDVDALRQVISQTMPSLLQSGLTLTMTFCIMNFFSVWMACVVVAGVIMMFITTGHLGSNSARFFLAQQRSLGKAEGYSQETMAGQRVIKVFTHEDEAKADFDKVNEELFENSKMAHRYANIIGPILNNMGNFMYVIVALAGGIFLALGVPNLSISGMPLSISIVVPFLGMTRQFAGQIGQVSNQVNSIVMALAGAERIFELMDEEPEVDEGYVTLVNACRDEQTGELKECTNRTGQWAWKHTHRSTGVTEYIPLQGDVVLDGVDFGYRENHPILHDVSLYAKPGQKVAFVGATGAGKTTITNLINRFYDIADGKIRYDGINVNKIKKADLRRSLGVVLQDVNLFTGTVMDNIRYGRLDASDSDCREAARLAGADSFIERLPQGYNTMLTDNGANLSQGQRQLLSIARAAVADPPVMILDEATSSIDTHTELVVQRGMDALMKGRTNFVIAHRLSTVQDADVIIVLDHGRIIERGNHDELIAAKGTYYQLYTGAFELE
ncbi:MAG: ABC transporter ATP-binding protein [Atopobiaceae bacterium]|nr:ABC transporter ATP-binding protein [Atopobiaceae bacterium]